jgi:hypothetical protein
MQRKEWGLLPLRPDQGEVSPWSLSKNSFSLEEKMDRNGTCHFLQFHFISESRRQGSRFAVRRRRSLDGNG